MAAVELGIHVDRDNLPFYVMTAVGLASMVLGLVGGSLGWRHLLGEVLSTGGFVVGCDA
jgi:hypothetical protein